MNKEEKLRFARYHYPDGTMVRCTCNNNSYIVRRVSNDVHYGCSESIYCGNTAGTDIRLYDHRTGKFAEIIGHEQKEVEEVTSELSTFPNSGYCQTLDNNLKNYLQTTRKNADCPDKRDIGIAWSPTSFWYVKSGSGKTEYSLEQLMPFICKSTIKSLQTTDIVVDKWYEICFGTLSHYVKFSLIKGIRGYLDSYGYVNQCKTWSTHDSITFDQITSIKEVSIETIIPFMPLGHPDWKNLQCINPCAEIALPQEYEFPKQIINPLKLKKDEHKSQRNSCKIQRPNIQIREGYTSRGVSIRSTKSKIQLRSDNSHY